MEAQKEIVLNIDGQEVRVPEGFTVLEAARQHGVNIPTLCHHEALTPWGGCRLCLVEVDGAPRLVASCVTPVRMGMDVVTSNERIIEARRTILEFMFAERGHYCMVCAQSGDCELQNLAYEYQVDHLSVPPLEDNYPIDASHPDLVIDHNRCVLCGRCVRACRELAGQSVLDFHNRGGHTVVGADMARGLGESSCTSCGLCVQVCPTGAIYSRYRTHYAVKGKSKLWQEVSSWCPQCGQLCPAVYQVKDNNLLKVEAPLPGQEPDLVQMCRRGRFDLLKSRAPRLEHPMVKEQNGQWRRVPWEQALERAAAGLGLGREPVLALASSGCSNEELAGFKRLAEQSLPESRLDTLDGGHFRLIQKATAKLSPDWQEPAWDDLNGADLILQLGTDLERTHPLVRSLIQRAILQNRAAWVVMGPENQGSLEDALHLKVAEPEIANWLDELMARLPGGPQSARLINDQPGADQLDRLAALWQKADRPMIVASPSLCGLKEPAVLDSALALARIRLEPGRAWPLVILKPAGNSAGAWQMGAASGQELNGAKKPKAGLLMLSGENLLDNGWPEQLAGLEFIAALTPYFSPDLARLAQVLLPRPIWLESEGTYANSDGSKCRTLEKVLEPPPQVLQTVEALAALADSLGRRGRTRPQESA